MKKVLILGSGMVAKPMVEYLLQKGITLKIASPEKSRADELIKGNPLGSSTDWSMNNRHTLERLVEGHDITVSLLPYRYHYDVARVCLRYKRSFVTTSYEQPSLKALDEAARKAGVIFLNETGLDPGIDHMTAMRIINQVHTKGGKVESLYSLCGALPAPEAATNPLKYKFTWSPKGVILASLNNARYLKKGEMISIAPSDLFKDRWKFSFPGIDDLEVYPNRDSISYINIYGIPEVKTIYRGTIRYTGWCETLDAMKDLNMLDSTNHEYKSKTYADFLAGRIGVGKRDLKKSICLHLGITEKSIIIEALDFLGFFSDDKLNDGISTPFDITSEKMISKMLLQQDERDMVILQHICLAEYPDRKREVIRSSLIDFGSAATNTAIAKTVSLPAAIAVKLILENKINAKGVCRPVIPEIYNPVLKELMSLGIEMIENHGLPESDMIL
jgi:saccharopine dehydrogenase (NADP+, L-glutamate forming)